MSEKYQCACCGGVFDKGWSDEEAKDEAAALFPGLDVDDPDQSAVVCDDCWRRHYA